MPDFLLCLDNVAVFLKGFHHDLHAGFHGMREIFIFTNQSGGIVISRLGFLYRRNGLLFDIFKNRRDIFGCLIVTLFRRTGREAGTVKNENPWYHKFVG